MSNKKVLVVMLLIALASCDSNNVVKEYGCRITNVEEFLGGDQETEKTFLYVQIPNELNEYELTKIAKYLRKEHDKTTFLIITFLLPEMEESRMGWATAQFMPTLEIKINGVGMDSKEKLKAISAPTESSEVVGKWYDGSVYTETSHIIYAVRDTYYLKSLREGGEFSTKRKLERQEVDSRIRFTYDNNDGEYLVIENDGSLGLYDTNGVIVISSVISD